MYRTFAIVSISLLLSVNALAFQKVQTKGETRELLTALKGVKDSSEVLATLFKTGDGRISDLIDALNDSDRKVSLRAQIVIRYLGNETGMQALDIWYNSQAETVTAGPVPLPLRERDYISIKVDYVDQPSNRWVSADRYIYALALDGSPRAKALLDKMMKRVGMIDDSTVSGYALGRVLASNPRKLLTQQSDLAKMVLKNAFFILPADRAYASSKLLGLNAGKNRALVEVYINRGHLAEEWYHVVISKRGRNWKFFSISQVAVS
jgi:hypothetical protein